MFTSWNGVVLQEVPGEISLAISISGCPLRCKGCHSTETYDPSYGVPLNLPELLSKHKHITCVVFYGGEWAPQELLKSLKACRESKLLTCLYTGYELAAIPQLLLNNLDFIKTGTYQEKLGPIGTPGTNQKFFTLDKGIVCNRQHM